MYFCLVNGDGFSVSTYRTTNHAPCWWTESALSLSLQSMGLSGYNTGWLTMASRGQCVRRMYYRRNKRLIVSSLPNYSYVSSCSRFVPYLTYFSISFTFLHVNRVLYLSNLKHFNITFCIPIQISFTGLFIQIYTY